MKLYEQTYRDNQHFSFGKNWKDFLKVLNDEKVEEAKKSLVKFLGGEDRIKNKTFIDIGSGSGLFSLAAFLLGASRVVSVDIDDFSVECVRLLKEKQGNPENWEIQTGSALDKEFINRLGEFDIVYSWGVLHHTGDMWQAIENALALVRADGVFYIALYNKNWRYILEGTSDVWVALKRLYNSSSKLVKKTMEGFYIFYYLFGLILHGINPINYIRNYSTLRGMDFFTDIRDWLGGYPYEYASVTEVQGYFEKNSFELIKVKEVRSIGCNEFLFKKKI